MLKAASWMIAFTIFIGQGWGNGWAVQEERLPAPLLLSPAPGSLISPGPVTLRWSAVEGAGAYRLVVEKDGTYEAFEYTVTGTEYTLTGLPSGYRYPWTVFALHPTRIDLNSDNAPFRHFTLSSGPISPAPPLIVDASDGSDHTRVRVSWSGALDADRYEVQRMDLSSGQSTALGSTVAFSFDDLSAAAGQHYRYGVRACNGVGCSAFAEDEGWAGACIGPGRVTLTEPADGSQVRYNLDTGEVWLGWQPVDGVAEYQVILRDAASGAVRLDATAPQPALRVQYLAGALAWQVRALDPAAGCPAGDWSTEWTYTAAQNPPPAAPVGVQAGDGEYADRVMITWSQPPSETEPTDFHILRAETLSGPRTEIDFTGRLYYFDPTVTPGRRYFYWVQACHVARGCSTSQPDSGWAGSEPLPIALETTVFIPFVQH